MKNKLINIINIIVLLILAVLMFWVFKSIPNLLTNADEIIAQVGQSSILASKTGVGFVPEALLRDIKEGVGEDMRKYNLGEQGYCNSKGVGAGESPNPVGPKDVVESLARSHIGSEYHFGGKAPQYESWHYVKTKGSPRDCTPERAYAMTYRGSTEWSAEKQYYIWGEGGGSIRNRS